VVTVGVAEVRAALDARTETNWGKLTLRGAACALRVAGADGGTDKRPVKGSVFRPELMDLSGAATVRTAIATRLALLYGVDAESLKLGFDPADDAALAHPTEGMVVEVSPGAAASSARMPVTVNLYERDRLLSGQTFAVEALVRRAVVAAAGAAERGKTLCLADLTTSEQWVSPSAMPPLVIDEIVGSVTQKRIGAGQTMERDDVAPPLVCKRGDIVYIHCISGSVVVKVRAKALAAGRDGEILQFKLDGAEEAVSARMSGRGRAVMVVEAAPKQAGAAPMVYGDASANKAKSKTRVNKGPTQ